MWVCLFGRLFNTLCLSLQAEGRKLMPQDGGAGQMKELLDVFVWDGSV